MRHYTTLLYDIGCALLLTVVVTIMAYVMIQSEGQIWTTWSQLLQ